ncbi:hypothetical protein VJY32_06995 [Ignavibacteria bacterium 4148-Me]|uniref:hypothetical protein n=1 Tax=Rosettibacter primus TaxID=3111523 RepID=UPI00336BD908
MELIDIIYVGLQISIALLGVVIILSYLISRFRLNNKKISKDNKSNLNFINIPSIQPETILKNNFYYSKALNISMNQFRASNMNLRYLKSSHDIFQGPKKHFNNVKHNDSKTRYTIINEEMRKKSNNSVINFW